MIPGMGTIINCGGVLAGGALGLIFKKGLPQRFQDLLITVCGLATIFLGISGTIEEMITVTGEGLTSHGTMMIIFSLALGAVAGEAVNLEHHIETLGAFIRKKSGSNGDTRFLEGFLNTSLTICIGAMAVVGAIEDGIHGDVSTLAAKAVLDLIIVMVLTASLGKGCIFSIIPLALFQGSITLCSRLLEPCLIPEAVSNLSLVGSMLIFCVGVNLMFRQKIPVANLLPSLVFAVAAAFLPWF